MKTMWTMTEKNWKNYVKDNNSKGKDNFSSDADVYGAFIIGNLRAEFQHTLDDSDWYPFSNVFALGVDDGYGDENGIPYALLSGAPKVPINAKSFEEFKSEFEKAFEEYSSNLPENIINDCVWEDLK